LLAVCKQLRRLTLPVGVVLALSVAAGTAGAARPLFLGLEIPNGTDPHITWASDMAAATKVQYVRIVAEWAYIAPTKPADAEDPADHAYKWASLDARVQLAVDRHLRPYVTIYKAPYWAERPVGTPGDAGTRNPDPTAFGEFARALALRYAGKVDTWEVWNEPNLTYFLTPQKTGASWTSPVLYRNLLNSFGTAVHAVNPSATIVAGATAPFKRNNRQPGPLPFTRRVLCLSSTNRPIAGCTAKASFEAWSTHPYTAGGPTHHAIASTDVSLGDLPELRRVLSAGVRYGHVIHANASIGFWVGEFSWDSNLPDPKAVPSGLHRRWVSEALYRAWRAGVSNFIWFTVRDRSIRTMPYQSGFWYCGRATRGDDGTCDKDASNWASSVRKPSWRAFYFPFVAYASRGRITVWGRTPGAAAGVKVSIERRTSSGWRRMTTVNPSPYGIFSKVFRSSLTRGYVRAQVISTGVKSVGFSLVRPRDRIVQPFGCGGSIPC
jgi:polysaccharide biosynthesis protein PslG